MPVEIGAEVEDFLAAPFDPVGVQVVTDGDHELAASELRAGVDSLVEVWPRLRRSPVVVIPGGPLLSLRGTGRLGAAPDEVVGRLVAELDGAGVSGRLVLHETNGLAGLDRAPNAVILRVHPTPGSGRFPSHWIDLAGDWLAGQIESNTLLPMRVLGVEFRSAAANAPGILHQSSAAAAWCDAYSGDLDQRIRTASLSFGAAPHLALGIGGPTIDSHGLLARYELLCDAATEFAPTAAYSCVDIEPTFAGLAAGMLVSWPVDGGAATASVTGRLCDKAVPDVFPHQILGPGHAEAMGGLLDEIDDLVDDLGDGKFAVRAPDPADWLPIHDAHDAVQTDLRWLLRPLLLTQEEVDDRSSDEAPAAPAREAAPATGPALADVVLDLSTHPRRGSRLTLLELVAWLSQSRHSDDPPGVSVVLATFGRLFGQGLDDEARQRLRALAPRLVATDDPDTVPRRLGPLDRARAWIACEWTVRVQGATWLRAAGLADPADAVESAGDLTDQRELLQVIDELGRAATTAGRRIDITLDIAGRDDDDTGRLDAIAWDVWERASESSAWVAASEAASQGVSSDLLYATDHRVIECTRDARVRDELAKRKTTVGDQAWSTAVAEVAAEAWREGWRVAADAVYELSTFSLDTATERSLEAVAAKLGLDSDVVEARYVAGEEAARARLAAAALRGGASDGLSAWDDSCRAARSIHGGEVWGLTFDGAADAVGREVHEEAMVEARRRVDEVLADAADMVARTVAVAVAREAAGAAARGLALRAAAIALAHGADDDEIEARAAAAIEPTVETLRDQAFELFGAMIEARPPG